MDALASFKRSRGVGTLDLRVAPAGSYGQHRTVKHYQRGQHSRPRTPAARRCRARRWETAAHGAARGHPAPRHGAGASPPIPSTRRRGRPSCGPPCGPRPPATRRARPGSSSRARADGGVLGRHDRRGVAAGPPGWAEGLRRAPVVLLAYASPDAYVARYAEPTRPPRASGSGAERWPVPYWFGDAAFGVMAVLLGAVDAGLGACILGAFRGEAALAGTPRRPGRMAALLRRGAGPARWAGPPLAFTGPHRVCAARAGPPWPMAGMTRTSSAPHPGDDKLTGEIRTARTGAPRSTVPL